MPAWLILVMTSWMSYRFGRFIVLDSMFEGTRDKFKGWLTTGKKMSIWKLKVDELITCPFCVTGWTSLIVVIATDIFHHLPLIVLWWGATWVGALLTWGLIDSDEGPRMEHGKK